jgi:hypothetical protein
MGRKVSQFGPHRFLRYALTSSLLGFLALALSVVPVVLLVRCLLTGKVV